MIFSNLAVAQHIDIDKKALSFLTLEENINVEFSYDGLTIDKGVLESDFLDKMRVKIIRHRDEREADQWAADYVNFKSELWNSSFIDELNKRMVDYKNSPTFLHNDTSLKYTMKVHIPWMYFGFDAGIVNEPAKVNMHIDFFETDNPATILFSTKISRAMGKYNRTDGDGEGVGPSLNRMRKAIIFGAFKLAKALKRVVD